LPDVRLSFQKVTEGAERSLIVNTGTARIAPGTPHIQYQKIREG
jgi:hypothetical protein